MDGIETSAARFEEAIAAIPGIQEATLMTGSYDYMLRVACRDQADLVRLIEALRDRAACTTPPAAPYCARWICMRSARRRRGADRRWYLLCY